MTNTMNAFYIKAISSNTIDTGFPDGTPVYWRLWTSDSSSGRPTWVDKLTLNCLIAKKSHAEKLVSGNGSTHFRPQKDMKIVEVSIADV